MTQFINVKQIIEPINRCYLDYAEWPQGAGRAEVMNAFRYYMEREAGIRLTFDDTTDQYGRVGYELKTAELVDEHQYLVWTLKWA